MSWNLTDCDFLLELSGIVPLAGWWFDACGPSNLNGIYYPVSSNVLRFNGIKWYYWKGPNLLATMTTMMVRPADFRWNCRVARWIVGNLMLQMNVINQPTAMNKKIYQAKKSSNLDHHTVCSYAEKGLIQVFLKESFFCHHIGRLVKIFKSNTSVVSDMSC